MPLTLAAWVRVPMILAPVAAGLGAGTSQAQWTQFGGPQRDFRADSTGLAESWPEAGSKVIWERELGDGYSSIIVDGANAYTMVRRDENEAVVALDAASGATRWETAYAAPLLKEMAMEFGPGPHATPLLVDGRLFTVGVTCVLTCLNAADGKVLWTRDLTKDFGLEPFGRGYASSPTAWKHTIILPIGGGPGKSLAAFDQKTGELVWTAQDFALTHSTPLLINLAGQDQLVCFLGKEVVGLNPDNGALYWRHEHLTEYDANIATPCWNGKDILFISSAYGGGARGLRLTRAGDQTKVEELWHTRRVQLHHNNVVCIDNHVYGASGSFGGFVYFGLDLETGKLVWGERAFPKATTIAADGKAIVLDQDGQLALLRLSPEGCKVLAKQQLLENVSWTSPTLVGTRLYLRDRKRAMALELGRS